MPVLIEEKKEISRLIILRGAPAVGKSTIASKIGALNSSKKKAYIAIDDFQLLDLRSMSNDREKLAIRNAALLTKNFLLEGFDVVVDYVFDDIVDQQKFMDFILGDELGKNELIFVQKFYLDAPIDKIIKRNQSRKNSSCGSMNIPLLRKLYDRTSKTKGMINHEVIIDTTKYSAKQCAKFIISFREAYRNDESLEYVLLPEKDLARSMEED